MQGCLHISALERMVDRSRLNGCHSIVAHVAGDGIEQVGVNAQVLKVGKLGDRFGLHGGGLGRCFSGGFAAVRPAYRGNSVQWGDGAGERRSDLAPDGEG